MATSGYGATVKIGSSTIEEVTDFKLPLGNESLVECTHLTSPGRRKQYVTGMIDGGDASFTYNFQPEVAGQIEAARGNASQSWTFTEPDGATYQFTGPLMNHELDCGGADAIVKGTVTVKVNSDVNEGSGS